jgi:hypothetical protein
MQALMSDRRVTAAVASVAIAVNQPAVEKQIHSARPSEFANYANTISSKFPPSPLSSARIGGSQSATGHHSGSQPLESQTLSSGSNSKSRPDSANAILSAREQAKRMWQSSGALSLQQQQPISSVKMSSSNSIDHEGHSSNMTSSISIGSIVGTPSHNDLINNHLVHSSSKDDDFDALFSEIRHHNQQRVMKDQHLHQGQYTSRSANPSPDLHRLHSNTAHLIGNVSSRTSPALKFAPPNNLPLKTTLRAGFPISIDLSSTTHPQHVAESPHSQSSISGSPLIQPSPPASISQLNIGFSNQSARSLLGANVIAHSNHSNGALTERSNTNSNHPNGNLRSQGSGRYGQGTLQLSSHTRSHSSGPFGNQVAWHHQSNGNNIPPSTKAASSRPNA